MKLSRVESYLEGLSYPATRAEAADACAGVTLLLADGEANLGALIEDIHADVVEDAADLHVELQNVMPIEAVGEPMQSEGDA